MRTSIGFIGLGKMGKNMVLHLLEQGVDVVGFNRTGDVTTAFQASVVSDTTSEVRGVFTAAGTIKELLQKLQSPRIIFLMVPNGNPVDEMLTQLVTLGLQKGDTVIDGGNTFYKDSVRRNKELETKGITFIDCGTSGGLEGARNGACLMLGGNKEKIAGFNWLWEKLAVKDGYRYFGPSGAGHFVKMVHNGIEYGMDQALGEGFELLVKGPYQLDLASVAQTWEHGSVIRSWLVELLAMALVTDPKLDSYSGTIGGGQTGTWTTDAAKEFDVPIPVIAGALEARRASQTKPSMSGKVVSALRAGYGGHGGGNKK